MSNSKVLIASLLLIRLLVLHHLPVQAEDTVQDPTSNPPVDASKKIDCAAACAGRCRLSSRQNLCHRACGTCCARCNCVPPGTSGNHEACRCYATMTTHDGRFKCP